MKSKNKNEKKSKKKLFIILATAVVIIAVAVAAFFIFLHKEEANTPEAAVKSFYTSLLPTYNAEQLEQSVGSGVYQVRFNDEGRFVDRYNRTREQIVYYYGEEFESTLTNFVLSEVSEADKKSITKDYSSKYSLQIEEFKKVSFTVTLSNGEREKTRTEDIITIKIGGKWVVYDYDAYWFAYM